MNVLEFGVKRLDSGYLVSWSEVPEHPLPDGHRTRHAAVEKREEVVARLQSWLTDDARRN